MVSDRDDALGRTPFPAPVEEKVERPVALVTGGTRGIGHALTRQLIGTHDVVITGRTSSVHDVAASLGAHGVELDLADEAATVAAASRLTRLDLLVHNAGIVPPEGVSLRDAWRAVFEVNVVGVVALTEALIDRLRASGGLVIFINSGSGLKAMGDTSGYSASKFALTSYADGLRERERGRVRVSSVHPGRVDTDMQRILQHRLGRPYEPGDHLSADSVAAAIMSVVQAPASATIENLAIRPA